MRRPARGGGAATRRSAGFTLLEVMVAVAIVTFITATLYGSFAQMVSTKRAIESTQERTHTVRVALLRMAREIEMAYLSDFENTTLQDRRTMLVGTSHGDIDELRFSAFAHQRLREDAAEGDSALISYYGEPDRDSRGVMNLMRRETRRLQAVDPKQIPGEAYILCPDVARVKYSFYDFKKKEWREDWSTLGADGQQYLPTVVRITLTVVDERGIAVPYSTAARIHITEKVSYRDQRS